MKAARIYWLGLSVLSALSVLLVRIQPADQRPGMWVALAVGVAVQGPLGWWLIQSVGTERFLGVWATGIFARFAVLALMALVVLPRVGPRGPGLIMLGGVLVGLLFFEGWVVWLKNTGTQA